MTLFKEFSMDAVQDVSSTTDPIGTVPQGHHPRGGPGDPPEFRRGTPRNRRWFSRLAYRTVSVTTADRAWRSLTMQRTGVVIGGKHILAAMGVRSASTERTLRRLYDHLGLIEAIPGQGDPDPDLVIPAEVHLLTRDPEAFARLTRGVTKIRVATSGLVSGPVSETGMSDWEGLWVSQGKERSGVPQGVCVRGETSVVAPSKYYEGRSSTLVSPPPPGVILERSDPTPPQSDILVSVPEVMAARGWSRATANRWLARWRKEGLAQHTSRGCYVLDESLGIRPPVLETDPITGVLSKDGEPLYVDGLDCEDCGHHQRMNGYPLATGGAICGTCLDERVRVWCDRQFEQGLAGPGHEEERAANLPYPPEPEVVSPQASSREEPLLSNLGGAHLSGEEDDRWHHPAA